VQRVHVLVDEANQDLTVRTGYKQVSQAIIIDSDSDTDELALPKFKKLILGSG
jgi:hypothetical protein